MTTSWIEEARRVPIQQAAASLGLHVREGRRASLACPACHATRRGKEDRRLPATVTRSGKWRCWACSEWGDVVDLVAFHQHGGRYTGQPGVREWFGSVPTGQAAKPLEVEPPLWLPEAQLVESRRFALPARSDRSVMRWLADRLGPDPSIRVCSSVRALSPRADLDWMRLQRRSWYSHGLRALFPTWDALGQHRGWRARRIRDTKGPKAVGPTGYSQEGLVLASRIAVQMLRGQHRPSRVIIAEGEPSYLAWLAVHPGAAVFGIGSGWWTRQHADRVPDGCAVTIATDNDKAGNRYADHITRTLGGRCTVSRWTPPGGPDARS